MRRTLTSLSATLLVGGIIVGCASKGGGSTPPPPGPTVNSVAPYYGVTSPLNLNYAIAGQGGFTLLVNGNDFTNSSVVEWNGNTLPTQFGDATDLAATVSNSLIASSGAASITVKDTASGAASNTITFQIASPATATAGVVALVTAAPDGSPANGDSLVAPSISANGRYVAFQSNATNLVPGPASGYQEIYERDTCIGAPAGCTPDTTRVTVTYDGSPVNGHTRESAISADGRYVAFASSASNILNLAQGSICASIGSCVFLRDTCIGVSGTCTPQTVLVSTTPDGGVANGAYPAMTPDARLVVFNSTGQSPGISNTFLHDTCIGAPAGCTPSTTLVSAASDSSAGNQNSVPQSISSNARYVAFDSWATNLVANPPTDQNDHLYVRDTCAGVVSGCTPATTMLDLNANAPGEQALDVSVIPGISADGRFVAFSSIATNMVSQNVQGHGNAYLRDTCNGAAPGCSPNTAIASLGNDGSIGNDPSEVDGQQAMSSDGRFIVFASLASNLVPGQMLPAGSFKDIFVRDTCFGISSGCTPSTVRVSVANEPEIATQANRISDYGSISADGHYVVFLSSASNLVPGTSGNSHAMVYIAKTGF